MSAAAFLTETAQTCRAANAASLDWLLARPEIDGGFLNTRQSSITLSDYADSDGWRSPRYLSGWIQGRGLEALVGHADALATRDAARSAALMARARRLAPALADLAADGQGHAYFAYDLAAPGGPLAVRPDPDGAPEPQARPVWLYTYSDAFVAKGFVAAAAAFAPETLASRLIYLADVIAAIESGRFQMDEKAVLGTAALAAQPDDFGPRMILLGAAGLLHRIGQPQATAYADRFIAHVLDRHYDLPTGLLRNVPDEDACNVGHGIEFVGFALQHLPADADPALIATLERILVASFAAGFVGPGIALSVSVETGKALSPYCPWWSLPETMRAAALVYARTRNDDVLAVWQAAHRAFFSRYWRADAGIAYQTLDRDGPVDFVPATPDLDPGYHTGLSLDAAAAVAEALTA
jgi:mannose/cellobiose epimerase-like protein (N-acyl-D-glucosamine 2-epimerase family)